MRLFKVVYFADAAKCADIGVILEEDRDISFLSFAQQIKNIQIRNKDGKFIQYCVTKTVFFPVENELFIHIQE